MWKCIQWKHERLNLKMTAYAYKIFADLKYDVGRSFLLCIFGNGNNNIYKMWNNKNEI